ncbi:rod shape determining protein RodA [Sinobacterium caligoides]|uniref:Peptidoglycan glycosyltransferase MrdB n=1 Tax=Sinobacterium caligoides TaxID=933926 RepID=A0A3N2DNX5_9GAMM|nr:rod shape-determining protein RodA [Sinobacterium caligoides]ROS01369.1 rod shape determining protein RodA [Sinobacterium caligoides]
MSNSDFVRQMGANDSSFSANTGLLRRLHIDGQLLILLLIVSFGGLFVLYSGSGGEIANVKRQAVFFGVAYFGMFVVAQFKLSFYRQIAPFAYVGCIALLVAVLLIGVGAKGAQRWLDLGVTRFQPSEVVKLVVPMTLAWYFSTRPLPPKFSHVIVSLIILMLPTLLIAKQPDLGTSILIASSGLFILFFAGLSWRYIAAAVAIVAASAYPAWHFVLHDYQKQRILTMLNPESDRLGAGWNIIQSKTAIGSGGWYGKGWLEGTQSHLSFLPESHTDFIIAVLAEEFGLRGVLLLMGLYMLIILKGMHIGYMAQDTFGRLLAGSITLTFFVYMLVNMGMVSGLLPVVGVPLPLVSQGGTALVTLMAGFGILMAISTDKKRLLR